MGTSQGEQPISHFTYLDALRGVAAISVVIYHCSINLGVRFFPNAFLAVDFFFVLSGFVIAHAYEQKLQNTLSITTFLKKRILRLHPLYILSLTVSVAVVFAADLVGLPHVKRSLAAVTYVFSILLLPTPAVFSTGTFGLFPLNVPAWSLSLEIWVNVVYALIARWLTTLKLMVLTAASAALLVVCAFHFQETNLGSDWPSYAGGWARVIWSFFAGILTYRFFISKTYRQLPLAYGFGIAAVLLAIFATPTRNLAWGLMADLVIFPVAVFSGALIKAPAGMGGRLMALIGQISYPLYISHFVTFALLNIVYRYLSVEKSEANVLPIILFWSAIAIIVAAFLNTFFDIPTRRWIASFSQNKKARKASTD